MENWSMGFEDPWESITGESRSGCSLLNGHQRSTQPWLNGSQGRLWIPQVLSLGGQGRPRACISLSALPCPPSLLLVTIRVSGSCFIL